MLVLELRTDSVLVGLALEVFDPKTLLEFVGLDVIVLETVAEPVVVLDPVVVRETVDEPVLVLEINALKVLAGEDVPDLERVELFVLVRLF